MNVHELNRDQLHELKERYLTELAEMGEFAEIMDVDYNEPSWGDLSNADNIVPDDVVYRYWEGVCFVPDDFLCTAALCTC